MAKSYIYPNWFLLVLLLSWINVTIPDPIMGKKAVVSQTNDKSTSSRIQNQES